MNTVGKPGRLGEQIRCVVSVSMLTEGWDANTVTHILGVRAFGTQLLCEQVVGRALRRQSYDLNEESLFDVEYADILGIPFDFTAKPVVAEPRPPRQTIHVHAVSPERDKLEITFPRVEGYRVDFGEEKLSAHFTNDSKLTLTPELTGPAKVLLQGIVGESADLNLDHLKQIRENTIVYHLTQHLLLRQFRDPNEEPKLHLFGPLKKIVTRWIKEGYLECKGGTFPAQVLYLELADMAANRIRSAVTESLSEKGVVKAILDPYNPTGSTSHVNFLTTKETRHETDARRSHVNWMICDSGWEIELCRVVEAHPKVVSYVKNYNMGFEVPYRMGQTQRRYVPDFIVQIDDGREDPLNLVIEVKGYRGEDAKEKANTTCAFWVPGVNNLRSLGRWQFAEFADVWEMEEKFGELVSKAIESSAHTSVAMNGNTGIW